jgi:thiosulfate/3-mercaptopyruvate sulfurtransferase
MKLTTLVSIDTLAENLTNPNWVIIDCHFLLDDLEAGRKAFLQGHIPGAIYAHLDEDLTGPIIPGKTSRHPLPDLDMLAKTFSGWGIDGNKQVIAYDDRGGAIAVRLWWMLKWLGHDAAAVLNGSFTHWKEAGFPITKEISTPQKRKFVPRPQPELIATLEEIETIEKHPEKLLVDSRGAERYRGEVEPIDPVAGHIPGAVNHFYIDNLDENGKMKPAPELEKVFSSLIGDKPPENVIFYCGSGVTSAHNVLAMAHAGLGMSKIYPGSWSEWIIDPDHQIGTIDI